MAGSDTWPGGQSVEIQINELLRACGEVRLRSPQAARGFLAESRALLPKLGLIRRGAYALWIEAAESACYCNSGEISAARGQARRVVEEAGARTRVPEDVAIILDLALCTARMVRGTCASVDGDYQHALELVREGLDGLPCGGGDALRDLHATLLYQQGIALHHLGKYVEARDALLASIEYAEPRSTRVAYSVLTLGGTLRCLGDYGGALRAFAEGLARNKATDNRRGAAWCLHNMADTLRALRMWPEATSASDGCLAILRGRRGEPPCDDQQLRELAYVVRSGIELDQGRYNDAARFAEYARAEARAGGNPARIARSLQASGDYLLAEGKYAAALERYRDSIESASESCSRYERLGRLGVADALSLMGEHGRAVEELQPALDHRAENEENACSLRRRLLEKAAEIYARAGAFEQAYTYAREAAELHQGQSRRAMARRLTHSETEASLARAQFRAILTKEQWQQVEEMEELRASNQPWRESGAS